MEPVAPKVDPVVPNAPVPVAPNVGAAVLVDVPNVNDEGFEAAPKVEPNADGAVEAGAPKPDNKIKQSCRYLYKFFHPYFSN